jgi:hypothetical protein
MAVCGGESVNCNGPSEEDNDVHIALVANPGDQECTSVTAEMSPAPAIPSARNLGQTCTSPPTPRPGRNMVQRCPWPTPR